MNRTESVERSKALTLGVLAVVCLALFPVMLVCAIALHFVMTIYPAMVGMLAFVASLPLAILAWRIGARELRTETVGMPSLPGRGGASRGMRLGRAAFVIWVAFVLFAALTYTRPL